MQLLYKTNRTPVVVVVGALLEDNDNVHLLAVGSNSPNGRLEDVILSILERDFTIIVVRRRLS